MPTAAEYRRWFDYEKDAHAKVLRSLESVPAERRSTPEFQRAVSIFAHIVAGRTVWLSRLGMIKADKPPLFPTDVSLSKLADDLRIIQDHWDGYLRRVTDAELQQFAEYQSYDAGRFRTRVEDILTHMMGHSLYHRGQIAMLVRTAGGEPASTDFIYWCRESIG